ncbi:MAG: Ig-like domain-containing protein, partial [Anaerolineales bacterium]
MLHQTRLRLFAFATLLAVVAMACNLSIPTPTPAPTPTAVIPLPPALVETIPPAGSQAPLNQPIAFYFNQAMDHASVEAAVSIEGEANGLFSWGDDATLVFTPLQPLQPNSAYAFNFAAGLKAANGLTLDEPIRVAFTTGDFLRLTHTLPENNTDEASALTAVVATFNQPVVPLGAEADSLPPAFTLQPMAPGKGQWLNTSTYIFYPEPAFAGGTAYTVTLNPALQSAAGAPLAPDQTNITWSFRTAPPRIIKFEPVSEEYWPLDGPFVVTFNQPMDRASVENGFQFTDANGAPVPGAITWDDKATTLTFTPSGLLKRGIFHTLSINADVRSAGGAPLGEAFTQRALSFPDFGVVYTDPADGGQKNILQIYFTTPAQSGDISQFVTVSPDAGTLYLWGGSNGITIYGYGAFQPATDYTVTISADLKDKWGQRLGRPFTTTFRTPPAQASLTYPGWYQRTNTILPQSGALPVSVTNIYSVEMNVGAMPVADYLAVNSPDGYNLRLAYSPPNLARWTQPLVTPPDRSTRVELPLQPGGGPVTPGIYYLWPQTFPDTRQNEPHFVIASNVSVTFKLGATDALVWAADLRTGEPLGGRSVAIYDPTGTLLASGVTDASGIFYTTLPTPLRDLYSPYHAVVSQPGQDDFGLTAAYWDAGLEPYHFGINTDNDGPRLKAYLYTDRPIYRPGQTVYFRGVLRSAFNGRYEIPNVQSVDVTITNDNGTQETLNLKLTEYGTFEGSYTIPPNGVPGYYALDTQIAESPLPKEQRALRSYFGFTVANYRKPEYEVLASLTPQAAQAGQPMQAEVRAQYYFGAPAGGLNVTWNLYRRPFHFSLPAYTTSNCIDYFECGYGPDYYGESVSNGEGITGPDGRLTLNLPADAFAKGGLYTLEATAYEPDGFPVSGRASATLHADSLYIGIRPEVWVGRSDSPLNFDLTSVDWDKEPLSGKTLRANFQQVTWTLKQGQYAGDYRYVPAYTPIESTSVTTGADGRARVSFTPKKPGTYVLEVTSGKARSVTLVWVSGAERAAWPTLPTQQVRLTADKDSYKPGETAQIFIPNPLGAGARALITYERGIIFGSQVVSLGEGGSTIALPLSEDSAPNLYVSALLLTPGGDFRAGYLNLSVAPDAQVLTVTLTPSTGQAAPGDQLRFDVRVTDSRGQPVQGEFSIAVVDKAVLALADPNSPDIVPAFYDPQALGVRTGYSLAVFANRLLPEPKGGRGGGGGEAGITVREEFPDTALWQVFTTDASGRAQISLKLPDNLTT